MKFVKYIALLALATVPLLLIDKKKRERVEATTVDDDDIFERELKPE
jgi:hypothetical protein